MKRYLIILLLLFSSCSLLDMFSLRNLDPIVNRIDTIKIIDTLTVRDSFYTIDTLFLRDSFYTVDTLTYQDTLLLTDTLIERDSIYFNLSQSLRKILQVENDSGNIYFIFQNINDSLLNYIPFKEVKYIQDKTKQYFGTLPK